MFVESGLVGVEQYERARSLTPERVTHALSGEPVDDAGDELGEVVEVEYVNDGDVADSADAAHLDILVVGVESARESLRDAWELEQLLTQRIAN